MQLYESIFIVRPSLSDEDTNKIIEKMKGVVAKAGATLLKLENWGKKKLAYEIKRERKGTFVYLHFRSEGGVVSELERSYRLEDSVLKFLTVRVEQVAPPTAAPPTTAPEAKESDRGRVQ
jgi:small subunit ribosomal protein S6